MSNINQLVYYNLLYEAEITSKEQDLDSVRKFFPSIGRDILGYFQMIFPITTKKVPYDMDYFNSKTKGLELDIYQNSNTQPNAYTLPGVTNRSTFTAISVLSSIPIVSFITYAAYTMAGFYRLSQAKLSAAVKDNIIQFSTPTDFKITAYETLGLRSMLDDDHRFSIMLHEIGHWINFEPVFTSNIFHMLRVIVPPLAIPFSIANIILARSAEWKADEFTKSVGYGKQLKESLSSIGYDRRSKELASIYVRFNDLIRVIFVKIHNIVDVFLPVTSHPSIKKRVAALQDGSQLFPLENVLLESIIPDDIKVKLIDSIAELFQPIDELISKNFKLIFPLAEK